VTDPNGTFSARAITRDVNSDKAKALAALGAQVVQADVDDVESLESAFAGAYGAFCVTFFWERFSPGKEAEQARKMATAAKTAGVQHGVWSTLDDTRKWVPLDDDRMPTLMELPQRQACAGRGAKQDPPSGVLHDLPACGRYATCASASTWWSAGLDGRPGAMVR
jgi:hypothetical protein